MPFNNSRFPLQVQEGLDKALRLQKQSKKKDYYKILGIKRLVFINIESIFFPFADHIDKMHNFVYLLHTEVISLFFTLN